MEKYLFITNDIIQKISKNIYPIGSKLPTVLELASEYNVSKHTVSKALNFLSEKGYIQTRKGSGCYVIDETEFRKLDVGSLSKRISSREHLKSKVILLKVVESTPLLEKIFSLDNKTKYFYFERVRSKGIDEKPFLLECTYTPCNLVPELRKTILHKSWYQYVKDTTLESIDHIIKEIYADILDENKSNLLNVENNYPCLVVKNIGYLSNGKVFEYSINYHINEKIKYYAKKL